jgi:hypothetical protein
VTSAAHMWGGLTGLVIKVVVIWYLIRCLVKWVKKPTVNYCGECGKKAKASPCAVCVGGH